MVPGIRLFYILFEVFQREDLPGEFMLPIQKILFLL